MPTYDYECDKCGYEFEAFHSMSEPSITDCPECHSEGTVRRLIGSGAGIIFKGSGFYETDYKRKSSPEAFSASKNTTETKTKKSDSSSSSTSTSTPSSTAKSDSGSKSDSSKSSGKTNGKSS